MADPQRKYASRTELWSEKLRVELPDDLPVTVLREVEEGAHARRQETSSRIHDVNR
jgi:hypothetical protein